MILAKLALSLYFFLTWFLIVPQKWSFLPLGRSMSALFGASLLICFKILSITEAFLFVNDGIQVLVLLFGLMILSNYCEKEGFFNILENWFTYRCYKGWNLILRIVIISGLLSAFLTNDAVCIFLTPALVRIAKKYDLPKMPLLLALGTSSNIGSAATLSGNPQNAYIGIQSGITYLEFSSKLGIVSFFGLFINYGCIWIFAPKLMKKNLLIMNTSHVEGVEIVRNHQSQEDDNIQLISNNSLKNKNNNKPKLDFIMRLILLLALTIVLMLFLLGYNLAVVSLGGALWVVFFEAILLHYEPKQVVNSVDYQLLIFFSGLFIVVGALTKTGYPQLIWDGIFDSVYLYSKKGITLFSTIVLVASNLISNVPAVVMATPLLKTLADSRLAWLLLAWVSTIAGNLTIIGSAAMIIVAERAYQTDSKFVLSSWKYLGFGIPSTLIVVSIGVVLLCILDALY